MTPDDLRFSWMLWLCVGWLIGYRFHVLQVRQAQARKARNEALDRVIANVAIACLDHPTNARVN